MRHDIGYVVTPKTQIVPCRECGRAIEIGWKTRTPKRCVPCGEAAFIENAIEIHEMSGLGHERRLKGLLEYMLRTPGGMELLARIVPLRVSNCEIGHLIDIIISLGKAYPGLSLSSGPWSWTLPDRHLSS
jgi:hypothetical protein